MAQPSTSAVDSAASMSSPFLSLHSSFERESSPMTPHTFSTELSSNMVLRVKSLNARASSPRPTVTTPTSVSESSSPSSASPSPLTAARRTKTNLKLALSTKSSPTAVDSIADLEPTTLQYHDSLYGLATAGSSPPVSSELFPHFGRPENPMASLLMKQEELQQQKGPQIPILQEDEDENGNDTGEHNAAKRKKVSNFCSYRSGFSVYQRSN